MRRVAFSLLLAACRADDPPTASASDSSCSASTGDTTGSPTPGTCEARTDEEECAEEFGSDGFPRCRWQPEFARWSEQCGCGTFAGPPRCLSVRYVGDGCQVTMCPSEAKIYYRELADGVVELMDYSGCDMQPENWSMCSNTATDPPACACFC
jgi:hypothetical protein